MVWNRNHIPLLNGTGLMGHHSATQSVLAVPKSGSKSVYFLFTVDAVENNFQNGLRYSILDMNLDGGLGGITNTKNVLLEVLVTEKLIAVRHGNEKDYWILAHKWNSDEFLGYGLTKAGLAEIPVISKIGSIHGGAKFNASGQMKANRQGTKIALAINESRKIEVFDFNAINGRISNAQFSRINLVLPYGIEFSGDGTKLYGTSTLAYLLQFNLADPADLNTVYSIDPSAAECGALQLGPDNKIYCNLGYNYLGVINNPDSIGAACNYRSNAINLNVNYTTLGLPNLLIPARQKFSAIRDTTLCSGESITLGEEAISGNSYLWQDGSTKSTLVVTEPGTYKLKVRNWFSDVEYEMHIQFKECIPKVPNIITPNQDNLNEAFEIRNVDPTGFSLQIFNRLGILVYETESYQNNWNVSENSAGIYYYFLRNVKTRKTFKGWLEVVK